MCRFVAYLGTPITVDEILIKPSNSIIHQSYNAQESIMTVNGDGFGLGWYDKKLREEPGLYKSISPAWNDQNLLHNASFTETTCFFAHVRAATEGSVSIENCHPFEFKEYLMMHNGGIGDFDKIKYDFVSLLDEEAFLWIKGQSDTQYLLALYMTNIRKMGIEKPATPEELVACFNKTFSDIEKLKSAKKLDSDSNYNIVLTNGHGMIATRYSTSPKSDNRSLHFAEKIICNVNDDGDLIVGKGKVERSAAIISSEKLTDDNHIWKEIPINHAVFIDREMQVSLLELEDVKSLTYS